MVKDLVYNSNIWLQISILVMKVNFEYVIEFLYYVQVRNLTFQVEKMFCKSINLHFDLKQVCKRNH